MKNKKSMGRDGFTLVELIVTLSIVAILAMIAVPSMQQTIRQNRLTAYASTIVTAFNIARSEAIRRGGSVSLCSSDDLASCRTSNITDWSEGWILFTDLDADGTFDDDGDSTLCEEGVDDCILQVMGNLSGVILTETANSGTTGLILYNSRGLPQNTITLDLTADNCGAGDKRTHSVNATGQVKTTITDC